MTCFVCTTGGNGSCGRTGCNYAVTCRETGPTTVPTDKEEEDERQTRRVVVGQPVTSKYYGESGYSGNVWGGDHHTGVDKTGPMPSIDIVFFTMAAKERNSQCQ